MAMKRKRSTTGAGDDEDAQQQTGSRQTQPPVHQPEQVTQEMEQLLLHLCGQFEIPVTSIPRSKPKQWTKWLYLRQEPACAPAGVFSTDAAVRLYYAHRIHLQSLFATTEAFARACVDAINQQLRTGASLLHIVRAFQADEEAVAKGVHRDRVLFQIREFAQEAPSTEAIIEPSGLDFIFRDDAIAVVNKPGNVLSVDGNGDGQPSIQSRIRTLYPEARMVHRLDLETSGILVIALTRSAAQHLNAQFRDHTVEKTYVARVWGHFEEPRAQGTIDLAMGPHPTEKLIQQVIEDPADAKATQWTKTTWTVLQHQGPKNLDTAPLQNKTTEEATPSTLMQLKPVTGKTHQLRVHMNHIGHPILGDSLYAVELVQPLASRLCLHAAMIKFTHPVTNQQVMFSCPHPF